MYLQNRRGRNNVDSNCAFPAFLSSLLFRRRRRRRQMTTVKTVRGIRGERKFKKGNLIIIYVSGNYFLRIGIDHAKQQ